MAILPIYTYDARVLREETRDVERPDEEIQRLIGDMFETMRAARGIGLAANQVGKGHSIFVIDLGNPYEDEEGEDEQNEEAEDGPLLPGTPFVFINPEIKGFAGDDIAFEEGCLSVPNLRDEVIRPESLLIHYRNENFEEMELEAGGLLARVIQHEYDHLQGIFFTDRLRGLRKRLVIPALRKIKRGDVEADYPLASLRVQDIIE